MSIQIMESVKRLSRQLAAAEERIKALEGAAEPDMTSDEMRASLADIRAAIEAHIAEKHDPVAAFIRHDQAQTAAEEAEMKAVRAPRAKRAQADD